MRKAGLAQALAKSESASVRCANRQALLSAGTLVSTVPYSFTLSTEGFLSYSSTGTGRTTRASYIHVLLVVHLQRCSTVMRSGLEVSCWYQYYL